MGALPLPSVAPGPHRDLVEALHQLHHRAGWPSLRTLARQTGVSHTTVSKALSAPALPSWGTVELLVEAMHGETTQFHTLWLAATARTNGADSPSTNLGIAGRQTELAAVRRHLETGSGLLLVTGEAGIGKTKLVTTAADRVERFVATGHCLPLSTQAPLMPVVDLLRILLGAGDGQWLEAALDGLPPFVRSTLGLVLPELSTDRADWTGSGSFERHMVFTAFAQCLAAMARLRPFALVVEDLHWADPSSADVLEHLLIRGAPVPIVGTWRLEDQSTPRELLAWSARVQRLDSVAVVELAPLDRAETVDQLRLLTGQEPSAEFATRIHARSMGQPLFTAQLAMHTGREDELPRLLRDVLDQRLTALGREARWIAGTLGVADRGLPTSVLSLASGLSADVVRTGLRELSAYRLLESPARHDAVQLAHPLLAEAVRRNLVAGEAPEQHRRLAESLASLPDPSPAEIAQHWQGAGSRHDELIWRVRAAEIATNRFAAAQAAEHWLRALDLWPDTDTVSDDLPMSRAEVYLRAMDTLKASFQFDRAAAMSDRADALFPDVEPALRAEIKRQVAKYRGDREGPLVGLGAMDDVIELYRALPPGPGIVRALEHKYEFLQRVGRFDEAFALARQIVSEATPAGDPVLHRRLLTKVAWHQHLRGALADAESTMVRSRALTTPGSDPEGDIWEAVIWTDALLQGGAPARDIQAAGHDALALAQERDIDSYATMLVRCNIACALMRAGRVADATTMLARDTDGPADLDRGAAHLLRAVLDVLSGDTVSALARMEVLLPALDLTMANDPESVQDVATIEVLTDRPRAALEHLMPMLDLTVDNGLPVLVHPTLVLAARAAADAIVPASEEAALVRDHLLNLYRRAHGDGAPESSPRHGPALSATWIAEIARLDETERIELWVRPALDWDRLGCPHDAAYCRWRAARVAQRDGQDAVAARLLKRAATDAREHVPLYRAIAASAASGR